MRNNEFLQRRGFLKGVSLAGIGLAGIRGLSGTGRAALDLPLPEDAVPSDVVALVPLPPARPSDTVNAATAHIKNVYRAVKSDGSFGILIAGELDETEPTYEYDVIVGLVSELENGQPEDISASQRQLEANPSELAFAVENLSPVEGGVVS